MDQKGLASSELGEKLALFFNPLKHKEKLSGQKDLRHDERTSSRDCSCLVPRRFSIALIPLLLGWLLMTWPLVAQTRLESDQVVLLHGLGRGPLSMKILECRLSRAGYQVHNIGYPWRAHSMEEIVEAVHEAFLKRCSPSTGKIHFVTHSLGGLVLRAYLAKHPPANPGRAVMLAPPNRGSEIVDRIGDTWIFRTVLGPMASQLGTGSNDLPARLPVLEIEVGVIAGNRSLNPMGCLLPPRPHDGIVSVESTRLQGMNDHWVARRTHTFIMNSKPVARQIMHFLREGCFEETNVP